MSLVSSLFSGVSGLRNHQKMMDVIGNNIANVNTVGFKGSRVTFSDTFNQYLRYGSDPSENVGGTNAFQVGLGANINSIDKNWAQGTFEKTGIVTDLALQGNGLFVLKQNGSQVYTRAGSFQFDSSGKLVSPQNGAIVQGKIATIDGTIPPGNNIQNIVIDPNTKIPAKATSNITWGGNLSSSSSLTRSEVFKQTGNISSSAAVGDIIPDTNTIYDDSGNAYTFKTTYTKTAANTYALAYTLKNSAGTTIQSGGPLTAVFDAITGAMTTLGTNTPPVKINILDATLGINYDYNPTAVTQNATTTTISSTVDDGRAANLVSGTVSIYDSLGVNHSMTLKFSKNSAGSWKWSASVPTSSGTVSSNTGTITFNSDGSIATIAPNPAVLNFVPTGGANPQNVTLNLGTTFDGVTQTSSSSVLSALSQNGSAAATLENITIDQTGKIIGVFSNGYSKDLAQLMIATFPNLNGLASIGDNLLQSSANSGQPFIGEAGSTVQTSVQSGVLEQSNVDLAEEFTRMIISQRGFSANAKVITTSDQMLQEITQLVR